MKKITFFIAALLLTLFFMTSASLLKAAPINAEFAEQRQEILKGLTLKESIHEP